MPSNQTISYHSRIIAYRILLFQIWKYSHIRNCFGMDLVYRRVFELFYPITEPLYSLMRRRLWFAHRVRRCCVRQQEVKRG